MESAYIRLTNKEEQSIINEPKDNIGENNMTETITVPTVPAILGLSIEATCNCPNCGETNFINFSQPVFPGIIQCGGRLPAVCSSCLTPFNIVLPPSTLEHVSAAWEDQKHIMLDFYTRSGDFASPVIPAPVIADAPVPQPVEVPVAPELPLLVDPVEQAADAVFPEPPVEAGPIPAEEAAPADETVVS
jgi:hypothetical protein